MNKQFCVYSAHSISELHRFQRLLGRKVDCALMFNGAKSWSEWDSPWFLHSPYDPNYAWPAWVKAAPGRRLIITQDLIPSSGVPGNWLRVGASGRYNAYAKSLAQNLVKAGLGNSVIRLAHEANGTWYADDVPNTSAGQFDWRTYWDDVVSSMRSVRGAHFLFDWTVNYQVRKVALSAFYPGNQYVDIVGLDAYDENTTRKTGRWKWEKSRPGGVNAVVNFAKTHGKQLSFAEWGLIPVADPMHGGGNDPSYINGIAKTIARNKFAYSGYWYGHRKTQTLLQDSHASVNALRRHFGINGDAHL